MSSYFTGKNLDNFLDQAIVDGQCLWVAINKDIVAVACDECPCYCGVSEDEIQTMEEKTVAEWRKMGPNGRLKIKATRLKKLMMIKEILAD